MSKTVTGFLGLVFCGALLNNSSTFAKEQGIDQNSIEWLQTQITIGEILGDDILIADSLEKLLQIAPHHLLAKSAQVQVLLNRDETRLALRLHRQLEKLFPDHQQVKKLKLLIDLKQNTDTRRQYENAKLLAITGKVPEAIRAYNAVFSVGFPSIFYELEYYKLLSRDDAHYDKAIVGITRLTQRYPGAGDFELQKARIILRKTPQSKAAINVLKRYAKTPRYQAEVEALWLSTLASLPLEKRTQKQYQNFLTLYPKSMQGRMQYESFQKDYAAYKKLLKNPGYQAYLSAVNALDNEESEKGYLLLKKALRYLPKDSNIIGEMGRAYLQLGRHDEARKYFEKALKYTEFDGAERWEGLVKTATFWGLITQLQQNLEDSNLVQAKKLLTKAQALDEDQDTVHFYKAELLRLEGHDLQAFQIYHQLIKSNPTNQSALQSILRYVETENNLTSLDKFSGLLTQEQNGLIQDEFLRARKNIASSLADIKAQNGDFHGAIQLLASIPTSNDPDPWFVYQQAQIWRQAGSENQGIRLFNEKTWQHPLNGELRYAQALYLSSIDSNKQANAALQFIPLKDKTPEILTLENELEFRDILAEIDQLIAAEQLEEAKVKLSRLELNKVSSSNLKAQISAAWYATGEQSVATDLLEQAITQDPTLAPYWHLQLGSWLLADKDTMRMKQWYENKDRIAIESEDELEQLERLVLDYKLLASDSPRTVLNEIIYTDPGNMEGYARLVSLDITDNEFEQAYDTLLKAHRYGEFRRETEDQLLDQALEKQNIPLIEYLASHLIRRVGLDDTALQQKLISPLFLFRDKEKALELAQDLVLLSSYESELVKQAGDLAEQVGRHDIAADYYQRVVNTSPSSSSNQNEAWYVTSARSGINRINEKTDGHIAFATDLSGQTSTQSDAELGVGGSLLESYFPIWDGHGFVKLDNLYVSAQSTDFTENFSAGRYGTGYLCYPQCILEKVTPRDHGVAIGLGWQNEQWRIDIGTTPKGFLIDSLVGGVIYQSDFEDFSYDIELRRRPLTNSLLSFAGMEDVTLDKKWGGVIQTGITLGAYYDLGLEYGFWSTLDYHLFKGLNVKDNDRIRAMGGGYYRLYQGENYEFTVGTNLLYWSYKHNLSEETFGHGGYYSPQSYYGLSIPVTFDGKWREKLVYRLRLGVGYSTSETEEIEFFPNNPELQAQALSLVDERVEAPIFEGSEGEGVSYNLQAIAEYHFYDHWIMGLSLSVDRAELYEPNYGQFYIKYKFNPILRPLDLGPSPISPYVNF